MNKLTSLAMAALATMMALPVLAQTATGNASSTSIITVPPRPMSGMPVAQTPGADSTFFGAVSPNVSNSQITFPIGGSGGGGGGGGGGGTITCVAGSTNGSQTATCPPGYLTSAGSATFTQTDTTTTTCPNGSYGAPSTSTSPWTPPSNTTTCPKLTPINDPSICAANGGMPYTITPLKIASGTFFANNVSSFSGRGKPQGVAKGAYTLRIAFNGQTQTFTATCSGLNKSTGTSSDVCDTVTAFSVGGGTFQIEDEASSVFPQDWVFGSPAPYEGHGTVTQTNCK